MVDNMALHEDDENPITPVTSRPFSMQFARFISTILSPIVVSLPAIFLVALYHQESSTALFFTGVALFFVSVGPMLYILLGVSVGKFTDIDVSVRSQRTGPFLFSIASSLIGFFVLLFNHSPKNLETILLLAAFIELILMVTTFWWKISIHVSALSGTLTMLTMMYGKIVLPAFLLVILVGWSRVRLKRHTTLQVIAGALVTAALTFSLLLLRGV